MKAMITAVQLSIVALIIILVHQVKLPAFVGYLYLLVSLITLLFYGKDKRAAILKKHRTPETNLHLLSLLGGWPGAILGQQLFRHKTTKQSFRRLFHLSWLTNTVILLTYVGVMWQADLANFINHLG